MKFVNLYDHVLENLENISEIKTQYLSLLSQLTEVSDIPNETFLKTIQNINIMSKIIIGIQDDIIICSGTIIIEPKLIHGAKSAAHIEDVVVLETWRKKGIALQLLENLQTIAKESECYKIILDCKEHLVPFYEKSGFIQRGIQMAQYL
jgi:glucosamine-phosphate N-acetyltransferase